MSAETMTKPMQYVEWTCRGHRETRCPQWTGRTGTLGVAATSFTLLALLLALCLASTAMYDGRAPYDPSLPPLPNVSSSNQTLRPWCDRSSNASEISNHSVVIVGDGDGGDDGGRLSNGTSGKGHHTWDIHVMALFWRIARADLFPNVCFIALYISVPHPFAQVAASFILILSALIMFLMSLLQWLNFPLGCYPDRSSAWGALSLMSLVVAAYAASLGCWGAAFLHARRELDNVVEVPPPSQRRRSSSSRRRSFSMVELPPRRTSSEYRRSEQLPLLA